MTTDSFLAFLGVSALVIATPGPDTAVTIRNTLRGGRRAGTFTAIGIATGQAAWAVATSLGIVALLVASKPLFMAVKYAGAAYLVYLGIHALTAAVCKARAPMPRGAGARRERLHSSRALRQGLVSNLGNPKMAVFFASLLPQFVSAADRTFTGMMGLGLVFCVITFLWLTAYAAVVARAGEYLRRSNVSRWVEAATGTVLIALGLRIATERGS